MTKYHREPKEIPTIGRRLQPELAGYRSTLANLQRMLRPGEVLVGYYDGGYRFLAPVLEDQETIDDFRMQYEAGIFIRMGYYGVPAEKLDTQ